jgi:F-box-like
MPRRVGEQQMTSHQSRTLLAIIASYLPEVTTVCRWSMVCKDFYNAVQHNDELWKNLADTVWVIARVPRVRPSSAETAATDTVRSLPS